MMTSNAPHTRSIHPVESVNFQNSQLQNLNLEEDSFYRQSNFNSSVATRNRSSKRKRKRSSKKSFNKSRGVYEALEKFERQQKSFISKISLDNIRSGYKHAVKSSKKTLKDLTIDQERNR